MKLLIRLTRGKLKGYPVAPRRRLQFKQLFSEVGAWLFNWPDSSLAGFDFFLNVHATPCRSNIHHNPQKPKGERGYNPELR